MGDFQVWDVTASIQDWGNISLTSPGDLLREMLSWTLWNKTPYTLV